jgi:hypothetical protein
MSATLEVKGFQCCQGVTAGIFVSFPAQAFSVYRVPWKSVELWTNSEESKPQLIFSSSEFHWKPSEAGH